MPVTRDAVSYAYRYLLNREPESETAIETHIGAQDWQALRRVFTASGEYQASIQPQGAQEAVGIGRHLDASSVQIDVTASPRQLAAMIDRISASWRSFGETAPHYSVLTNPIFLPENLAAHLDSFFGHGRHDVEAMLRYVSRAGLPVKFGRALDFGCGVGRMTIALAHYADETVGVDISAGHLREAMAEARQRGLENAEFKQINKLDDIGELGSFDLIISRIVLQHNPPPVMAEIYRRLLSLLAPSGVAVVQMPTFIKGYRFDSASYVESEIEPMEMNALPQREIYRIIADAECILLEVREDDHLGVVDGLSHTFAVQKP